jgi:hypothetical protein
MRYFTAIEQDQEVDMIAMRTTSEAGYDGY